MALAILTAGAGSADDLAGAAVGAARCAAFWYGYDDYAQRSGFLDRHPGDTERARAFRSVAYRLDGGDHARVDAYLAENRGLMELTMEAMIYGGDSQSRDIFDRLTQTCDDLAARHPETRDLR